MGERFGRYSKYIIQERALPDIRDGLKPVQRRILYSMNKDGNTHDKGYRKSAKSVGNIMGISTLTGIVLFMMPWSVCLRTGRIVRFLLRCTVTMVLWTVIHRRPCVIRRPACLKLLVISFKISKRTQCHLPGTLTIQKKSQLFCLQLFQTSWSMGQQGFQLVTRLIFHHITLLKSSMRWST